MFCNLFDSHTHSEHSPDGASPVALMAERAERMGLGGLAVTDHYECEAYEEYESRLCRSFREVTAVRDAYAGRLCVTRGVEMGQLLHDPSVTQRAMTLLEYDFVLASVHRMVGWEDFYYVSYGGMSQGDLDDMFRLYFSEMMRYIKIGGFDVLAHLSFPARYIKLHNGRDTDLTRYREEIDAVLRSAVERGIGIELNTSGLRTGVGETAPPAWVIARYVRLGGEIVTVGSDAHLAGDIGKGLQEGMELLLEAGLRYTAFFRERKPVMLRIL